MLNKRTSEQPPESKGSSHPINNVHQKQNGGLGSLKSKTEESLYLVPRNEGCTSIGV